MDELAERGLKFISDPENTRWVAPAFLLMDAVLCGLILRTTDYTEIDWKAYMQQVEQYIAGERDYTKIYGSTGPLVYPAAHVYIYRGLHAITQSGQNIVLAQVYFVFLYIFTLGMVMACYRYARAPPYIFPMLVLSKRLHSIFLLRCFNDCFAVCALFIAIYCYQRKKWTAGTIAYSLGLGVKMNMLLVLPAIAVILYQTMGPKNLLIQGSLIVQIQVLLGLPFLRVNPQGYLMRAFDFTREFKYFWSVNWQMISEERFLSKNFSIGLLVAHVSLLLLFLGTRWLRPLGRSPRDLARMALHNPSPEAQKRIVANMSADFIPTTIFTANAIGMLCARSLHYQFYSWIAWATPFLLWRAKLNIFMQFIIWFGQEMAWNIFPPNELQSKLVVGALAAMVVEIWIGTDEEIGPNSATAKAAAQQGEGDSVAKKDQ